MANVENSESLKQFTKELYKTIEGRESKYLKEVNSQQNKFSDMLKESSIEDKRLMKMLQEQQKATGKYRESLNKLINDYSSEMSMNDSQREEMNKLIREGNLLNKKQIHKERITQQIERTKKVKENPLEAFSFALKDFKKMGLKEGAKTLGSGLKEGISFKNISKGVLHTAGLLLDNPAINILANNIESSVEERKKENVASLDLIDSLNEVEVSPKKESKSIEKFEENVKKESDILQLDERLLSEMKSMNSNIENVYMDLGSTLENIYSETEEHTQHLREMLFVQKDSKDDLTEAMSETSKKGTVSAKSSVPEVQKDKGLFGDIDIGGDLGGDKDSEKKGKKRGKLGTLKSIGKGALKMAKFAGPIGLAIGSLVSIGDAVSDFNKASEKFDLEEGQEATKAQKFSAGIGGFIESASFGYFSGKDIAKKVEGGASIISRITTNPKTYSTISDLESKGIIDTSTLGDSKIRDFDAIRQLSLPEVKSVLDYDDWDNETEKILRAIISSKKIKPVTRPSQNVGSNIPQSVESKEIPERKAEVVSQQPTQQTQQTQPVVISQRESGRKIENYNLESGDILTVLPMNGVRL